MLALGCRMSLDPQCDKLALGILTDWYPKANAKLGRPNTKPCGHNAKSGGPNASQWNMVHVGYARFGFALGMYISCCLCLFHLRWVPIYMDLNIMY